MLLKIINIVIAGGSGFWAETNHYPAIKDLKKELRKEGLDLKVIAIYDLRDPYTERNRVHLKTILKSDKPVWVNPEGLSAKQIYRSLDELNKKNKIDAIIVATDPTKHYVYSYWAAKRAISVLCDKPLVVCKNASSDLNSARQIQKCYRILEKYSKTALKKNKNYLFCSPLRRRALSAFVKIAENLSEAYERTGEGLRHLDIIINNGINRFPQEFLKAGAHGYLDGVGSLAHSSYHYIDVMAWYLSCAPGKAHTLEISLPYVYRVKDYIKAEGYEAVRKLIADKKYSPRISDAVLNTELDFTFNITIYDKNKNPLGSIVYTSNHSTFAPRAIKYSSEVLDHANLKFGGRMSHIYIDVHQGAVQTWQLIKNDIVFEGNSIFLKGRRHPKLGKPIEVIEYKDAYDKETVTPKDLLKSFIRLSAGERVPTEHLRLLSGFGNQALTHKIFSSFFELVAANSEGDSDATRSILLKNYL